MSKIQTIIYLFVFLIVLFSMDIIFGNHLRETFTPIVSTSNPSNHSNPSNPSNKKPNKKVMPSFKRQSDDQPLHFSFPSN